MKTEHKKAVGYLPAIVVIIYMAFLALWRGWFVVRNVPGEGINPWMAGFWLDLSMACGAYLLVFVPILLSGFGRISFLKLVLYLLTLLPWVIFCIVEFSSILMYSEWGAPLDARAISYLRHPEEAWASTHAFVQLHEVLLFTCITVSGLFLLTALVRRFSAPPSTLSAWLWLVFSGALAFLGLRGGWQKLPIVPADAFYSSSMDANFAATNKTWYLFYTMTHNLSASRVHADSSVNQYKAKYHLAKAQDSCHIYPMWHNKNIVVLLLEGWSASEVSYTGGRSDVAPFFDSLARHSICFSNAFSAGFRTDQGLMNVLSGIPSIGSINMPNALHKISKYPSLPAYMHQMGRTTAFYYGGDLNFANLRHYLSAMDFKTVISKSSFPRNAAQSEWGVPDRTLLQTAAESLEQLDTPFFGTILLLSSHAPFDIPDGHPSQHGQSIAEKYRASVQYSDAALRHFFNQSKHDAWYNQSVFILVADHGTTHVGAGVDAPERFHIPMIIYDPSVSEQQMRTSYCNHFDIAATVCAANGLKTHPFIFSRNLFNSEGRRCAYWNTDQIAACYCPDEKESLPLSTPPSTLMMKESVLFLDWTKRWFEEGENTGR